ncbi:DUF882 domain-containing protein [Phyllobacterium sp. 628]|nr:DUF882 domain-containing protein [Phyllobacterium sp. 628]
MPATGTAQVSPEALALAGGSETNALKAAHGAGAQPAQDKAAVNAAIAAATPPPANGKTPLLGSSTAAAQPENQQVASAPTAAVKPPVRTSLFGSWSKTAEPAPVEQPQQAETPVAGKTTKAQVASGESGQSVGAEGKPATRPQGQDNGQLVRLFANNANSSKRQQVVIQPKAFAQLKAVNPDVHMASVAGLPSATNYLATLPGVRPNGGIQIMQRDSLYADDDVEAASAPVILASAAGLARLAPNGLRVQRESVDVACLKPQLVGMLKSIERRFGKSVIVTSGYRSPPYNRLVNGAKASLHMSCAAADIQVPGISKWELANFARSMPGRGGVGTYCSTESVHVDIGPTRDWNWRCGGRRRI